LAKRAEAGIKVKQPLSSYKTSVKNLPAKRESGAYRRRANVKEVAYDAEASAAGILDIENNR
jgi:hypothetical protein